jgi:hypothetical protein
VKYLLLLNNDVADVEAWRSLSPEEAQELRTNEIPLWNELFSWAGEQDLELQGLELDDPDRARVVRVRDGAEVVSDGPFAETKEQIGGYVLVDCKDLDQAIEVAQHVPSALTGSVEIRPLVE